jgi:hypothetical protein
VLGLVFDQLTVTVSPEYFTLGKGLDADDLRLRVAWLGFRSALPLGTLTAGLGLLRASKAPPFSWSAWLAPMFLTLLVVLPTSALLMFLIDPFGVRVSSAGAMTESGCSRYLVAWGLHVGAYAGVLIGLGLAVLQGRRHG